MARLHSKGFAKSMGSPSRITMQTMGSLPPTHGDNHAYNKGQGLTFAGGAAHHQNGIAERWIRELQEMMSTMLIHAHHRWPSAITPNLWPYALRMANKTINVMPNLKFKDA